MKDAGGLSVIFLHARISVSERLTKVEIEERFDSEWVLLDDPETDENYAVLAGTVLFHSKDHDEVYRKGAELRLKRSAVLYTGKTPEALVLMH